MPDLTTPSSGGFLSGTRANDVLAALQNGVQAINNAANTITTKISSVVTANPGGSSGQVQFNTGIGFGGFTVGGDATLVSSAGTLTINSHAITYGKIQTESSGTLLGNLGTGSTSPSEQASSAVTAFLTPFSSTVQGVVNPSSNSNSSGFFLGGDNAFHPTPANNFTYLGTVTTVSSQIVDTSTTTNLLNANATLYRSFQLILKNIIPNTNNTTLSLQVHSTGAFQTTTYLSAAFSVTSLGGTAASNLTTGIIISNNAAVTNTTPGLSGMITVSNLGSTVVKKHWNGQSDHLQGTNNAAQFFAGWWDGTVSNLDGFQIVPAAGAISSGSVDVYGIT